VTQDLNKRILLTVVPKEWILKKNRNNREKKEKVIFQALIINFGLKTRDQDM